MLACLAAPLLHLVDLANPRLAAPLPPLQGATDEARRHAEDVADTAKEKYSELKVGFGCSCKLVKLCSAAVLCGFPSMLGMASVVWQSCALLAVQAPTPARVSPRLAGPPPGLPHLLSRGKCGLVMGAGPLFVASCNLLLHFLVLLGTPPNHFCLPPAFPAHSLPTCPAGRRQGGPGRGSGQGRGPGWRCLQGGQGCRRPAEALSAVVLLRQPGSNGRRQADCLGQLLDQRQASAPKLLPS